MHPNECVECRVLSKVQLGANIFTHTVYTHEGGKVRVRERRRYLSLGYWGEYKNGLYC